MSKTAEAASFLVRIPPQMKAALEALAEREHRSTNGQIAVAIEDHLASKGIDWRKASAPKPAARKPAPKTLARKR